LDWGGAVVEW